jgi:hypothetical protein
MSAVVACRPICPIEPDHAAPLQADHWHLSLSLASVLADSRDEQSDCGKGVPTTDTPISEDKGRSCLIELVQLGGLEPPTSCSTDRRSNQLSYNCILRKRAQKGGAEWPETRCNAQVWQGRDGFQG